ncbi:MAG: 5-methyltetrahydropteroyltriglutamate--homocysteine S-methyltransferase [Clostridiales bacterium]|jgi:5-methyltetrahydropteroyltriglutamate--homocysteine methyltransferase|nr:5-methyltetrahydropteroyltriglutamate--homocysteine S-methyltransferase [Clostridiales bacterium]
MKTSVVGYPRIGAERELKFATEKYFGGALSEDELQRTAAELRLRHWQKQRDSGVDFIPSGDFSFYDNTLDASVMLGLVPARYRAADLGKTGEYFAMARGYQGAKGDLKALAMKKWFHTNYHYLTPEIEDGAKIVLDASKILREFNEAKAAGILTRPTLIGPFTFLRLSVFTGKKTAADYFEPIAAAYKELIRKLEDAGAEWIALDEPALVCDLTNDETAFFAKLYGAVLAAKRKARVLIQTYFGDVRDCYKELVNSAADGIGLDFLEGKENFELIKKYGFPGEKTLFAGVVNGKNIWRNDYAKTLAALKTLAAAAPKVVISTSCSLLHSPYSLKFEDALPEGCKAYFAFAEEKLTELNDLKQILDGDAAPETLAENERLFRTNRFVPDAASAKKIAELKPSDFERKPDFYEREKIQRGALKLPLLPTTTIGSFPQTADVKSNRAAFKAGKITADEYAAFNRKKIAECVALQEQIGLDVLVHGEYERNDMVEYFGENLDGFLFTRNAWVQSYGTRCVKPPVIWGDISRAKPITVEWASYAQSLTDKPVKGMLTGPVTIFNWSFPREDVPAKTSVLQLALAIRAEVLDLEAHGIRIIQIDEAALREKLPLRKADRYTQYLDWAIPAFRLVHSGVAAQTQIHTHMCYSEFGDIIKDIDALDADVISFEASRSNLSIIDDLNRCGFKTQVGPGVYDIHSPRIPSKSEIEAALTKMLAKIAPQKLWVNPDCGLKTRGVAETTPSLQNLTAAAKSVRKTLPR